MASSQMNQALLDNWTLREQLSLASAVSCVGEKNWYQVSRKVKEVYGNKNEEGIRRPADWFSPESCALQYRHLLESMDTGKKKKPSPRALVKMLNDKRIKQLKTEIRQQQEEYAEVYENLQRAKSPSVTDEELLEMWQKVEKEKEEQRIADMKLKNQLREREQRKQDTQLNWRLNNQGDAMPSNKQEDTAFVDMDVEEIIGVGKPIVPVQQQQQQQQQQMVTSPFSLSPSSFLNSPTVTDRTITISLTSESVRNTSDLIPPENYVQLLSRPICGPPVGDAVNASNIGAHNLLSPSQSASSLPILLEKNRTATATDMNQPATISANATTTKVAEFKKEAEPIEIAEDVAAQSNGAEGKTNWFWIDSDERDLNEDKQLAEFFKKIAMKKIDNEDVDFLNVNEQSPIGTFESLDFENKTTSSIIESNANDQSHSKYKEKSVSNKDDEGELKLSKAQFENDVSKGNVPSAAVATLENQERNLLTPTTQADEKSYEKNILETKLESAITCAEDANKNPQDQWTTTDVAAPIKIELKESVKTEQTDEEQNDSEMAEKMKSKADTVKEVLADTTEVHDAEYESALDNLVEEDAYEEEIERFSTPTGDDKCSEKETDVSQNLLTVDDKSESVALLTDNAVDDSTADGTLPFDEPTNTIISKIQENTATPPTPSHISIDETAEDSCTIITSTANNQEEKHEISSNSSGMKHTAASHGATHKSTDVSASDTVGNASKQSLLSILSNLSSTKSAQTIQLALSDDQLKGKYQKNCYRRLDFQTIKKSIENGTICSVIGLQRDLLQLAQNIIFLFDATTSTYKAAEVFKHEMQNVREFFFNTHEFEVKTEKEVKETKKAAGKQGRTRSRKSQRKSKA